MENETFANDALVNINGEQVPTLELLLMLTLISLLPSLLIMCTSFLRTIIMLSFLRNAMGIQQSPPNMVLVGIALFLTLYIMTPVIDEINETAYQPYVREEITQREAWTLAQTPLKEFMLRNTEEETLNLFMDMANEEAVENAVDLPLTVVIPSFMTTELKRAFTAGFLLYIPFLLIDIIVSSTLMSMGMMMLPPAMISLPFKLLLFVTVDGWQLLFSSGMSDLMYEFFLMVIQLAGPPLLLSMLIGILIAIIQAATQIHEQTLTFVPKLLVIGLVLVFTGSSMLATLQDFTIRLFRLIQVG